MHSGMDIRQRPNLVRRPSLKDVRKWREPRALASDALPLPMWLTNLVFFVMFFGAARFLLTRWKEKKDKDMQLHRLEFDEQLGVLAVLASFMYMICFFGIEFVQTIISRATEMEEAGGKEGETMNTGSDEKVLKPPRHPTPRHVPRQAPQLNGLPLKDEDDETIAQAVFSGVVASHLLEKELDDCERAAAVRRRSVEIRTGQSLTELPLHGLDYSTVMGQCCEMVIGHVQIPVGVAGPLLLDGESFMVPMGTTEGCLVASTNRGCKAITLSGGATTTLMRDAMTRAPAVRFGTAKRATEMKFFLENPENFDAVAHHFNKSSRFARLQSIQVAIAGRNAYIRFACSTGDAMGMNMVSKGVQNVLEYLQGLFPDMDVVSISGNFCADKKATAVNWIEGRGRSVVCEAVLTGDIIKKVLKTDARALADLNVTKNLIGSSMAAAVGGFNAHAANIVAAVFIATGQDPAQVIESSACMTLMELVNGEDLHVSVTMPSIEVGTVGGGTQLASQAASLNLLGVKGANSDCPGGNAQRLARVVAGAVLAGELSLMAALSSGHLVKSHMQYNRSSSSLQDVTAKATGRVYRRIASSPVLGNAHESPSASVGKWAMNLVAGNDPSPQVDVTTSTVPRIDLEPAGECLARR
eukprot:TRINITY_DN18816_c0_g1_i1.p1 TRINITY_DN18816_c0_g1~~TRINITY_DN18816_c0_g1_i1.p1  ORF type:complete len:640 (+),score=114.04 TRINITY_DN18816_c0_g1_i1:165-2084(+)